MWNLRKYGALEALKMPMIKQTLPRYVNIITKDLPAKFQIAKRIVFHFDGSMNTNQLWEEHAKLMKKFYEIQAAVDKNKLDLNELEEPRFSLLDLKIMLVEDMLKSCSLCEHMCGVNRVRGESGKCGVPIINECNISSESIHLGEEAHIVPSHTIFFMGCNFHCQFCQNWTISQWAEAGGMMPPEMLAEAIKIRKRNGTRNVNWVGGEPTPQLLSILKVLKSLDVNIAQIWNSNFYMSEKTMKLLDGIVDMYLSDFKYGNDQCAHHLSKVENYFEVVSRNHLMAAEQAEMTVRHLVLPDHVECCTMPVLKWIADNIRTKAIVNIMDQYYPAYKAHEFLNLKRRVTEDEMDRAIEYAKKLKLRFVS